MVAAIKYAISERIPNTRLSYMAEANRVDVKRRRALFKCDCGGHIETDLNWVRFLNITSCGCLKSELLIAKNTKHSQASRITKTGAYRSWQAMHQRIKVNPYYSNLTICDRWCGDEGFKNFYADMGDRPKGLTLERKENTQGYFPNNCKWATYKEQANNTRATKRK